MKVLLAIMLVSLTAAGMAEAKGTACANTDPGLVAARDQASKDLAEKAYRKVTEELKPLLSTHPEACPLRLILARAYLYSKDDKNAALQFRRVLAEDPQNRMAKLELARIDGYHYRYSESNALYRELLAVDYSDEIASIGLVRNLIRMKKIAEASDAIKAGLAAHPSSLRLHEYQLELSQDPGAGARARPPEVPYRLGRDAQNWSFFISDSAGDRIVENLSKVTFQLSEHAFAQVADTFRYLLATGTVQTPGGNEVSSDNNTISATTFDASSRFDYHVRPWLMLTGGGGAVVFDDKRSKALFQGAVEVRPGPSVYLDATYTRTPVVPTQQAAVYNLTAQGLQASLDWLPHQWRIHADASELRYSDSNHRHLQNAQAVRWFGAGKVNFGAGYSMRHFMFDQTLNHGYFSPTSYQNHAGTAAVRVRQRQKFSGEYRFNAGAESIGGSPFSFSYELSAENSFRVSKWDVHADYTFFHFTQSTGAFQTNLVAFGVKYHF